MGKNEWRKSSTKFQTRRIEVKIATATAQINIFTNSLLNQGAFISPRKRKRREEAIFRWTNKILLLREEEKRLLREPGLKTEENFDKVEKAAISDSSNHDLYDFNDGEVAFSGDLANERFIFGIKPFHALDCHTITVLHCLLGIKVCSDYLLHI